ncbi:unnamed protein product [Brassica oleracea var. botrytis]
MVDVAKLFWIRILMKAHVLLFWETMVVIQRKRKEISSAPKLRCDHGRDYGWHSSDYKQRMDD